MNQMNIKLFTKLLHRISDVGFCPAQKLSSESLYMKEIALSASEQITAAS